MKESRFVGQNKTKWSKFDKILQQKKPNPVDLNRLFIELTDDLSYARTRYRNRSVRVYLNWMMQRIFNRLYRRKRIRVQDMVEFFRDEIPFIMYISRKYMLVSFLVFALGVTIGVVSSHHDPSFATLVLGEDYVQQTLNNIESGNPMAIYQSLSPDDGFIYILFNNARIDIMTFATGLIMGILSLFFLIKNAVMVGVFQFFFYQHGGFSESVLTIWMHGAIEISVLILICGAGLLGGSGWMFPGTRTRFQAFRISGLKAAKLLVAILPFTLIAALIEAFLTPVKLPVIISILFILLTFGFMLYYFVIYPYRRFRGTVEQNQYDVYLPYVQKPDVRLNRIKSVGELVIDSFYLYGGIIGKIALWVLAGTAGILLAYTYFGDQYTMPGNYSSVVPGIDQILQVYRIPDLGFFFFNSPKPALAIASLVFCGIGYITLRQLARRFYPGRRRKLFTNGAAITGFTGIVLSSAVLIIEKSLLQFCFLLLIVLCGLIIAYGYDNRRSQVLKGKFPAILASGMVTSIRVFLLLFVVVFFLFLIVQSPIVLLLSEFFMDSLGNAMISPETSMLVGLGIALFLLLLLCPLFIIAGFMTYFCTTEKIYSLELKNKLETAGLI